MRSIGVLFATLAASAALCTCGGFADVPDAVLIETFPCTGGDSAGLRCLAHQQYCEQSDNGSMATGARCLPIPVGCGANPCSGCLSSGLNGIIACSSVGLVAARATTVTVRR